MTRFAKIVGSKVTRVIVCEPEVFEEQSDGLPGQWVQVDAPVSVGFTFVNGTFVPPQPFSSWVLTPNNEWTAPTKYPTDGKSYQWDESATQWVESQLA